MLSATLRFCNACRFIPRVHAAHATRCLPAQCLAVLTWRWRAAAALRRYLIGAPGCLGGRGAKNLARYDNHLDKNEKNAMAANSSERAVRLITYAHSGARAQTSE